MAADPRRVVALGSTGSIGTQALQIIDHNPGRFTVAALAAAGTQIGVLATQILRYQPDLVAITDQTAAPDLLQAINAANEEAVQAFRQGQLPFPAIVDTIAHIVTGHSEPTKPSTLEEVLAADSRARHLTREHINRLNRRTTPAQPTSAPAAPNPIPAGSPP